MSKVLACVVPSALEDFTPGLVFKTLEVGLTASRSKDICNGMERTLLRQT